MSKFLSFIIFLLIVQNILSSNNTNNSTNSTKNNSTRKRKGISRLQKLIKWGLNNSLNMTKDLKFSKKNRFIAQKFITIDDIIMDIPPNLMLNVKRALELIKSPKLKKEYQLYLKEDKENQAKKEAIEDEAHVDQSFLAYILYLVEHKKKKYEKTEFYKYYKHISYMFEDNLDNLPFSYSSDQMRLFSNTTFGTVFTSLNKYFIEEASLFEKKIYHKPIIFEDYLKYRIFSVKKYYNISQNGGVNLVPFIDLIKQSHNEPNCIFYEENGHIKLRAILNVFPGEELILKPQNISNQHRLIFYGETFDEILDVFPSYSVPVVARNFLISENIEIDNKIKNKIKKFDMLDLCVDEFYKYVIDIYTDISIKKNKKHNSEIHALRLFVKYLKKLRSNLDLIDDSMIRDAFYSRKDMDNAMKIFKGERMFLDKKIGEVVNYMKQFKKFKKILDKSRDGVIDIDDL
jgi:hypothetical protein